MIGTNKIYKLDVSSGIPLVPSFRLERSDMEKSFKDAAKFGSKISPFYYQ
ncbi:hypothetical protein HDC90_003694 [Pedobacter sp. AK013]|nr:hypothetical protein [Pedobacter sp. AK013]